MHVYSPQRIKFPTYMTDKPPTQTEAAPSIENTTAPETLHAYQPPFRLIELLAALMVLSLENDTLGVRSEEF